MIGKDVRPDVKEGWGQRRMGTEEGVYHAYRNGTATGQACP